VCGDLTRNNPERAEPQLRQAGSVAVDRLLIKTTTTERLIFNFP
jgi:hypothetical protein